MAANGFIGDSSVLAGLDDIIRDIATGHNGLLLATATSLQLSKTVGSVTVTGSNSGLSVGLAVRIGMEDFVIATKPDGETMTMTTAAEFTETSIAFVDPMLHTTIKNGAGQIVAAITTAGNVSCADINSTSSVCSGNSSVSGDFSVTGAIRTGTAARPILSYPDESTVSGTVTLASGQIKSGILYNTGVTATWTLPTDAAMVASVTSPTIGDFIKFYVVNQSGNVITITEGGPGSLYGTAAVAANTSAEFGLRFDNVVTESATLYRLS